MDINNFPAGKCFKNLSRKQKKRKVKMIWNTLNIENTVPNTENNMPLFELPAISNHDSSVSLQSDSDKRISSSGESASDLENCEQSELNYNNDNRDFAHKPEKSSITSNFSCTSNCSEVLTASLSEWIKKEKEVPHNSVCRLLSILSTKFTVPKTVTSLLKYEKLSPENMGNGEYIHFEHWLVCLQKFLESHIFSGCTIDLCVNIDGLCLFNNLSSSKYHCYPILIKVLQLPSKIFCVGIYCSNNFDSKEMPESSIFLDKFFSDVQQFNMSKAVINEKEVNLNIKMFVCDAPVRASLKNVILHSGYHSCERCDIEGEYHGNTVVFLCSNCCNRSDESFLNRADEYHHKSSELSILERNGINMVTGFVLDVMHLCYLGITKRILTRLLSPKCKQRQYKLSSSSKEIFHKKLVLYQSYVPSEFNRKLEGGINAILRWKVSQLRLVTLYVGVVIFANKKITSLFYQPFLKYSVALRLLNSEDQKKNLNFIRKLLVEFNEECKTIFGLSFLSYNVHNLVHIPDDYLHYGVLDKLSAFQFESFLGSHIKGAVRGGYKPLMQVGKHIQVENENIVAPLEKSTYFTKKKQCDHDYDGECLKIITHKETVLKPNFISKSDCYVQLKNGRLGLINHMHLVNGKAILEISTYETKNFFVTPVQSSQIDIYKMTLGNTALVVVLENIRAKVIVLPHKKNVVGLVLLHSLSSFA